MYMCMGMSVQLSSQIDAKKREAKVSDVQKLSQLEQKNNLLSSLRYREYTLFILRKKNDNPNVMRSVQKAEYLEKM